MTLFGTAFRLGIEPVFFKHACEENAQQTYATITKYFTILGCVILLFVVVYIDLLKVLIVPDSTFWEALVIVPVILLANLCLGIYHNLSVWYKVTDRTRFGALISSIGAVITLCLNFILIPVIGYKGSALATLAAYGSMMVISYLLGQRYYAVPYDLKKILSYLLIASLFAALSFYVFDGDLLMGTALLLVFLLGIYLVEKNELKRIARK